MRRSVCGDFLGGDLSVMRSVFSTDLRNEVRVLCDECVMSMVMSALEASFDGCGDDGGCTVRGKAGLEGRI
jgi:hypothetical protein